jgi:hypothetical protein
MSKLSLSLAWDETKAILARDGQLFGAVALALFVLPGLIVNVSVPATKSAELPPAGPWVAIAVIAFLISLVGQLSVIRLAMGPHVSVGEAIAHGSRRLASYVGAVLIWIVPILLIGSVLYAAVKVNGDRPSLAAAIAFIILFVSGTFLAVRLVLSSAVASAETAGPVHILRRSWDLSGGNWWRLFVFLLSFGVGALCLLWAVESILFLLARVLFQDSGPLSVGGLLVAIVAQLLSAAISVVFFVMLARIYVQRSGESGVQASVPSSGT